MEKETYWDRVIDAVADPKFAYDFSLKAMLLSGKYSKKEAEALLKKYSKKSIVKKAKQLAERLRKGSAH